MATTNPPLLPISTTTPASQTPSTTDPATTPGLRFFLSRFSDSIRRSLSDRRPWSELIDRSAFSRPDSLSDATSRVRKNLGYFRVNYAAVIALCLAASLLSHPFSLAVLLALLAAWCFLYLLRPSDPPLVLFGRTFSDRETLLGLVVVTFLAVFLTSVGSLIISALVIGSALVCLHGAFRMPEDLFLDEVDSVTGGAAGGLLSFLGGAGSTVQESCLELELAKVKLNERSAVQEHYKLHAFRVSVMDPAWKGTASEAAYMLFIRSSMNR